MALAQPVFKSHVPCPCVRLHFLGVETTQDFQLQDMRCGSEGAKAQTLRTSWQVLWQAHCLLLNKFQRPFYLIFIFKLAISCHLASFKIICFHFIIILCLQELPVIWYSL